eukprot:TRINITY_DN18534_c0_g1_i1.p2 TRINITY_DN18534_c0_g1~~TRINITY_DN18534_c0_g1_i1.p2  ORF type:complete len:163 (-),score=21.65 TRINITY_DN18534_c0_g1_i1:60-548(-)
MRRTGLCRAILSSWRASVLPHAHKHTSRIFARRYCMTPVEESFAVIQVCGHQFKVTKGDYIHTEKIEADAGKMIHLKKVLLLGTKTTTLIGRPLVDNCIVEAEVQQQTRANKVIVFKKKRRKGYRRTQGHRQPITVLRIGDIKIAPDALNPPPTSTPEETQL